MKADTVQLVHIFGTDRRHVVPIFQRPYVWEEERNWAPLWTDVKSAAEEVEAEQAGNATNVDRVARTHFLGAIVLERLPVAPGRIVAMNVIDGQQRLTTLQVLLTACRAAAKASGASNAEQLIKMLLNNTEQLIHPEHPEERYKVWPSLPDRNAFREVQIAKLPPRAADEHQLIEARRYFDDELNTWLSEATNPVARADALVIAIRERLGLVEIQLEEQDDAQIIFETLNDRGTRLQAADLVKNTLFRLAEQQGEDVSTLYKLHWQPFEANRWREQVTTGRIRRARIDLLLSYWLSIHTGSEVPVERLFADFRIWLKRTTLTAAEVLADLAHHGRAMQRMENLQATTATGRLLQVLDLLTTSTPIPVMLHLHARDGVSDEQRSHAARAIESYLIRRMVCGLTTKDYNRLFLSILQNIRVAEDHTAGDQLVKLLADQSAPSRYWPNDDEFIAGVLQPNIYRVLRGPRLRVMLGGIETALRREKSERQFMPAQVAKLTVEHLIPQKWSQFYPLPTDRPAEEAEARRDLAVHKLGNLTLTTTKLNSSISNGSWPTKRKELNKHAVLLLTAGSVLQAPPGVSLPMSLTWPDTWDEDRVELRTLFLATIACQAWAAPTGFSADQIRSKVASTQADIDALMTHRVTEVPEGSESHPEPEVSDVARRAVSLALEGGTPGNANTWQSSEASYSGPRRSIASHITEAFDEQPIGTFLSVGEIRSFESSEYGTDLPSAGAISAALKSPNWDGGENGIVPGNGGEKGIFGATKAAANGSS
jgi:hypothetical protein